MDMKSRSMAPSCLLYKSSCLICDDVFLPRFHCFSAMKRFDVIGPSTDIFALLGEDVTLPASLSPPLNAQRFEVTWVRNDFYSVVLLYWNLQIRPERQMQAYKGRATLFPEELVSGNVSLRLQDVRVSDGGLYRCLVTSERWNEETHLTLNVEGISKFPFFFLLLMWPLHLDDLIH
uniref:Ig-like domain-containing protein n=1 Tax=Erpetoichthys calabaricus TaxID=27687 RepID=A0A8C4SZY7_ERPCA